MQILHFHHVVERRVYATAYPSSKIKVQKSASKTPRQRSDDVSRRQVWSVREFLYGNQLASGQFISIC